jgi:pilus assembly protein CpaB
MIALSFIAAGVAVWMTARWVSQQAQANTVKVMVSSVNLGPGDEVVAKQIKSMDWPSASLPEGTFKDAQSLEGRFVVMSLYQDEPFMEAKLAPLGSKGGLSSTIQKGKRAISLQVNEIVGVAGYIRPGSLVDVMVNTQKSNGNANGNSKEQVVSKIILEKVLVLAAAQDDKRDQTKPKVVSTVTLEVEPQQAEKIDLARHIGTLSLVLRNPLDQSTISTSGAYREALLPEDPRVAPATSTDTAKPEMVAIVKTKAITGASKLLPNTSASPDKSALQVEVIRGVQKGTSVFEGAP